MDQTPRPLPGPRQTLAIAAIAIVLATVLGVAAAGENVLPGDVEIARAVQRPESAALEDLARFGHHIGSTLGASVVVALAVVVALLRRARPEAIFLLALVALRLPAGLLKPVFASPRPTADLVTIAGVHDGTGFPSGHAMTGAAFGLGFAVLAWRGVPSRRWAVALAALSTATGVMIGWSRVALGAHWPSDVLGGWLYGTAIAAIATALLHVLDRRARRPG